MQIIERSYYFSTAKVPYICSGNKYGGSYLEVEGIENILRYPIIPFIQVGRYLNQIKKGKDFFVRIDIAFCRLYHEVSSILVDLYIRINCAIKSRDLKKIQTFRYEIPA